MMNGRIWEQVGNEDDWNDQIDEFVRIMSCDYQEDHGNLNNQNDRFERDWCIDEYERSKLNDRVEDYEANQ